MVEDLVLHSATFPLLAARAGCAASGETSRLARYDDGLIPAAGEARMRSSAWQNWAQGQHH